jgi:hypothetical protein
MSAAPPQGGLTQALAPMRTIYCVFLLLLAQPVSAAGMTAVQAKTGFCSESDGICYEWFFSSNNSIRFIAHGDEDGIEYGFYTLLPDSRYEHIIRIYPVIRDASRENNFFWGYPWDIKDIVTSSNKNGKNVLATFVHSVTDDGVVESPAWQKRVPVVLFNGRTTQAAMTMPPLKFKSSSLHSLRSAAGG